MNIATILFILSGVIVLIVIVDKMSKKDHVVTRDMSKAHQKREIRQAPVTPQPHGVSAEDASKILDLIREEKKIDAIKAHRELFGSDLKSAKEIVEEMERDLDHAADLLSSPPQQPSYERDATADEEIVRLIQKGDKIKAIKLYRETYGTGLKEAKQAVDNWPGI